jgi:hypothetical protein
LERKRDEALRAPRETLYGQRDNDRSGCRLLPTPPDQEQGGRMTRPSAISWDEPDAETEP